MSNDYYVNIPRNYDSGPHVRRPRWRSANPFYGKVQLAQNLAYSGAGAYVGAGLKKIYDRATKYNKRVADHPNRKRTFPKKDRTTPKRIRGPDNKLVLYEPPKDPIKQNMAYSTRGKANYVVSRRKKRRSKKKRRPKVSKKVMKYVKRQVAKPDWSYPRRLRSTGYTFLQSALNKVFYQFDTNLGLQYSEAFTIINGTHGSLSYVHGFNETTAGVQDPPQDMYVAGQFNQKVFKYRWDTKMMITNSGNCTCYLQVAVLKGKRTSQIGPNNMLNQMYENNIGKETEAKEDDLWRDLTLFKRPESRFKIHAMKEVVINAGENTTIQFHVPWESYNIDHILNRDDDDQYMKNAYSLCWRLRGQVSHDASVTPLAGLTPSGISIAFDNNEYTSFLGGAEAVRPTLSLVPATATSTIKAAEQTDPGIDQAAV